MMAKKHDEHTTSLDSPPIEVTRDTSHDSPRQEVTPADPKNSEPIQSDAL